MNDFGSLIFFVILLMTFCATLKVGTKNLVNWPTIKIIRFCSNPFWLIPMILLIPMTVGEISRGEATFSPWIEFMSSMKMHGFFDGVSSALITIMVEIWLLWIPAHYVVLKIDDADAFIKIIVRIFGFMAGVLVITNKTAWMAAAVILGLLISP